MRDLTTKSTNGQPMSPGMWIFGGLTAIDEAN